MTSSEDLRELGQRRLEIGRGNNASSHPSTAKWVGRDAASDPACRGWLRRAASSRGRSHPRGRSASILTACRFFAETATGSRECWPGRASRDPRDAFGFCCISRNEDRDRSGLLHRLAFARGAGDPASGEHGHG